MSLQSTQSLLPAQGMTSRGFASMLRTVAGDLPSKRTRVMGLPCLLPAAKQPVRRRAPRRGLFMRSPTASPS